MKMMWLNLKKEIQSNLEEFNYILKSLDISKERSPKANSTNNRKIYCRSEEQSLQTTKEVHTEVHHLKIVAILEDQVVSLVSIRPSK